MSPQVSAETERALGKNSKKAEDESNRKRHPEERKSEDELKQRAPLPGVEQDLKKGLDYYVCALRVPRLKDIFFHHKSFGEKGISGKKEDSKNTIREFVVNTEP